VGAAVDGGGGGEHQRLAPARRHHLRGAGGQRWAEQWSDDDGRVKARVMYVSVWCAWKQGENRGCGWGVRVGQALRRLRVPRKLFS
jgi:hypothetical protein